MECLIDGCQGSAIKRGWCSKHYQRWRKHGTTDGHSTPHGEAASFLVETVLPYVGDDCLFWPYASVNGYAQIGHNGKTTLVTRIVCEKQHGPGDGMDAAHSCGNGHLGCVTPSHLSWKTRAGNMADARAHGTLVTGERVGTSKLSAADVVAIRSLGRTKSTRQIAALFPVSQQQVSRIINGERWSSLLEMNPSEPDEDFE